MGVLQNWKFSPAHKPLLIKGQRKVGKTFLVREFAKSYPHSIEINFLENPALKDLFRGDLDVPSIISRMKLYFDPREFVPGKTLLFFDEIQECPEARTSLKWFCEDGSYDVIVSGLLLGIADNLGGAGVSVPVGYERILEMKGLDFEEFLWACGITEESISEVRKCIHNFVPLPEAFLSVFESRFRDFMVVGGMPESVQKFIERGDYTESRKILLSLVESVRADLCRHNTRINGIKNRECFDSIPHQLDQSNKKFMYSRISGEGSRKSAEKYMDNMLWIKGAGYGNFCYSLYDLSKPMSRNIDRSSFRVYLSDTGTLANMYGLGAVRAILNGDYSYNLGALAENAVAECLVKSGYQIAYRRQTGGSDRMELDFLIENSKGLIAIEVKSGKSREAPSISNLAPGRVDDKIMFRSGNICEEKGGIKGYPLFASAFLGEDGF